MSSKELVSAPHNYKPEGFATSPYLSARAQWDARLGHSVVQARNWRFAFLALTGLTFPLLFGNLYQMTQKKLIPVVVAVNPQTGIANVVGKAQEITYQPKEEEIKYFLGQFIQRVRRVPSDPVVIKKAWMEAYKFLNKSASITLNSMTNEDENSPLKKIGQLTVSVDPITVMKVAGSNSYQVRWNETVFSKNGAIKDQYVMAGVFTIEIKPPSDEETMMVNPLGLTISTFQWAKEL